MGFWNGTWKVASNLVTFGGAYRLEEAKQKYEQVYTEHQRLCVATKACQDDIKADITLTGKSLKRTKPILEKASRILKRSVERNDNILGIPTLETLGNVDKFNSDFNAALGIGTGAVAGTSVALGTWAMVGAFGSASTGAAISGLSGAAATNATFAWLGGGTLAAGGAGMSGGAAVLGGVVALPLIAVASFMTHKKANQFLAEAARLEDTVAQQMTELAKIEDIQRFVRQRTSKIGAACADFSATSKRLFKIVRPWGLLSLLKQKVLRILRRSAYTPTQVDAIAGLNVAVSEFLCVFHQNGG
jgi:hypothetical protein